MADIKKVMLDSQIQEKLWSLIYNEDEVITDILGTEVKLTVISPMSHDQREVIKEIESDLELQNMLRNSEEDEKAGRNYSVEEAIKYIQNFHAE